MSKATKRACKSVLTCWAWLGLICAAFCFSCVVYSNITQGRPSRIAPATSLTVTEITNLTTIEEYTTEITEIVSNIITYNETTEVIIRGKGNTYYQINFDLNDVNFLLTESSDYDRTVVMTSNTTDFEQLIIDANLVINQELDVNDTTTLNAPLYIKDVVAFTYDPNLGDTGASPSVDWSTGNKFFCIASAATCTFTFTDPITTQGMCALQLVVHQDGAGSRDLEFPANVYWNSDTEPTWSTTAGDADVINFVYCASLDEYYATASTGFNP